MQKIKRDEELILGGLLHPVAASLVLLVSTRPLLILCATMARIQREQDADTRWTVRSHSWLLSGEFLAPALPDAAVARVVSVFDRRFEAFSLILFLLFREIFPINHQACYIGAI